MKANKDEFIVFTLDQNKALRIENENIKKELEILKQKYNALKILGTNTDSGESWENGNKSK